MLPGGEFESSGSHKIKMTEERDMTQLNQIVAVVSGFASRSTSTFTEAKKALAREELFNGMHRVYEPKDELGDTLPGETQVIQRYVPRELARVSHDITQHWDAALTRDIGNMGAKANIEVDEVVIARDLPVPFLLFLGNQLSEIRALFEKLPVLDPSRVWSKDANEVDGYRTEPTETVRSTKTVKPLVLHPPTDKHPAQVATVEEQTAVGKWLATQVSGAVTEQRKRELILRVEELQAAVRQAVEVANGTDVDQQHIGEHVFGWLLK